MFLSFWWNVEYETEWCKKGTRYPINPTSIIDLINPRGHKVSRIPGCDLSAAARKVFSPYVQFIPDWSEVRRRPECP